MSQFSFCRIANTETAECVFVWGSSFLTQTPSHNRNSRFGKKIRGSTRSVEDVAIPDRFPDAAAGRAVVSAAILSREQLSADLLKIYLR